MHRAGDEPPSGQGNDANGSGGIVGRRRQTTAKGNDAGEGINGAEGNDAEGNDVEGNNEKVSGGGGGAKGPERGRKKGRGAAKGRGKGSGMDFGGSEEEGVQQTMRGGVEVETEDF